MDWFAGLSVLSLESRRSEEMGTLIGKYGGLATVAPSMRETEVENGPLVSAFYTALMSGDVHMLACMTGVGTKLFLRDLVRDYPDALPKLMTVPIVARGSKPLSALKTYGLKAALVPRPHTWREVQDHLQANLRPFQHAVVLEYGEPSPQPFVSALSGSGIRVTSLPVYRCALPDDTGPLERAVLSCVAGQQDVLLLSSGRQILHFLRMARQLDLEDDLRGALGRMIVASIGPACTEAAAELGVQTDWEANPHKMGILVRGAAEHASAMLGRKRAAV
jgi:uroporphyrinogen-III synthase